ncbi:MAG: reprolysin-like metallopeptidase [Phycisphaerales bacterium]
MTMVALVAGVATGQDEHRCGVGSEQFEPAPIQRLRAMDRPTPIATGQRGASLEDGSLIDILLVYTPTAATNIGGTTEMLNRINIAVDNLNLAMTNSGLSTQFRLVHTQELVYTESGDMFAQLEDLRVPDDGVMDDVHNLRDQYKADLVSMITNSTTVCGVANFAYEANTPKPEFAFSVINKNCLGDGSYTFAHEIGHNLGMVHDWIETPCANGGQPYAKGYTAPDESFQTVMGVSGFPRVGYFSNPSIDYMGQPTGIPVGMEFEADNALSVTYAAPLVAKFRDRDMNANGQLDTDEIMNGTLNDCNANNYPDAYELDFNRNGVPDECDIADGTSQDLDFDGVPDEAEASIIRVNQAAAGATTGLSWTDAKTDLQDALALAHASGDVSEIWVAAGTYKPSHSGQRARYFDLHGGTSLLGGFVGTETDPTQRPESGAQAILSGDLSGDDLPGGLNREDNTLHVLYAYREPDQLTIDRFTITGGAADLEVNCGPFIHTGGGMMAFQSNVVVTNCEFTENTGVIGSALVISNGTKSRIAFNDFHHNTAVDAVAATAGGPTIYEGSATVHLNGLTVGQDNQFVNNRVQFNEVRSSCSGVYIAGGDPIFANNLVTDNIGYGIYSNSAVLAILTDSLEITNSTIANNSAPNAFTVYTSGVYFNRGVGTLKNSIVWNNSSGGAVTRDGQLTATGAGSSRSADYSVIDQWDNTIPGTGSHGLDPLFVDSSGFAYSLQAGSPAIDMGDNASVPADLMDLDGDGDTGELIPVDYAGIDRFFDDPDTVDSGPSGAPVVDAGAYEYQPTGSVCIADLTDDGILNFFDVSAFLSAFAAHNPLADFTGDGIYNFFDVSAFLSAFAAGCP